MTSKACRSVESTALRPLFDGHYGRRSRDKFPDFCCVSRVNKSRFSARLRAAKGGNISNHTYQPAFKLTLGFKDVNLALDAAKAKHAKLPAAEIIRENLQQPLDQGLGDKDWSTLTKATRRRAGQGWRKTWRSMTMHLPVPR